MKTDLTLKLEREIWLTTVKQGVFGCYEVTIGQYGRERVDFKSQRSPFFLSVFPGSQLAVTQLPLEGRMPIDDVVHQAGALQLPPATSLPAAAKA